MNPLEVPEQSTDTVLQLASGALRMALAPSVGGAIAAFWSEHDGVRTDWLRPATQAALEQRIPSAMASYPLLPWCNRIRDGHARFGVREIDVPPGHPAAPSGRHPLHGLGWLRPWTVDEATPTRAKLSLQVDACAAWPWRFEASQVFELNATGLSVTITLTNRDDIAMPAAIGHHPYFPHHPGTRLQTWTEAMWRGDSEVMPVSLEATPEVEMLRDGVGLDVLDLDNNFTGWQHSARIEWPGNRHAIVMAAESPLDFFVLYCPRGADHFCAEPVSQCTDAINLSDRYPAETLGGTVLAPGASLTGRWTLRPEN